MFDVARGADELGDLGFALDAGAIVRCSSAAEDRGHKENAIAAVRDAIRDSRMHRSPTNSCWCARHEGLFQLQFAQTRVAQHDLAPILAAFASKSVILTPPRFGKDYSAHARLVISVETPRVRTSDAEHDQGVSRKPSFTCYT
jgi:hypothetical protein